MGYFKAVFVGLVSAGLVGCIVPPPQLYWFNANKSREQTAKDLYDCRNTARADSQRQIYTAQELEHPCMVSKGYSIVDKPPVYVVK